MKKYIACIRSVLCCSSGARFFPLYSKPLVAVLLVITLKSLLLSLYAVPIETLENLVDENRSLSVPMELHLTSANAPLINSTISLNHEDAWLFFDNIKPSLVIENYVSNVLINEEQLVVGVNGRVVVYGKGTLIMAHPSNFKPLTVYTEENFGGTSQKISIQSYYKNLGELDNAIKSFKLKRGYMATFANSSDGSGYSRVFIADKEDIEISVMPGELYGLVSFIRVFKHRWVSKKGWCGWNSDEYQMVNASCYYDWNVGGSTSADIEYTPIRQNAGWPSWSDINEKQNVSHLLGFNEPDRPDQANMNFQQIINIWPGMMQSGLRVGSPAWSNPWGGDGGNLFDFINKCDELNYRVDFVALHCYWGGKSAINWYNDLKYIYEATGRPLWITEWNNGANWTTEWWPDDTWELTQANAQKQLDNMKGILQVLDTAHFVERYFIYNWVEDRRAMVLGGQLTPAGEYYAANKSEIAYNSMNEVIPHWNYSQPDLSIRHLKLSNTIRLDWTDENGELSRSYILERKINDADFETILSSEDNSISSYNDNFDPELAGTIRYRLGLETINGDFIYTGEVSYYQIAGEDSIQAGNFILNDMDWKFSLFSEKYSADPLVILGIPSFNNTIPVTLRTNNISEVNFSFRINPWSYLSNPAFTKTDILSALAMPSGSYNFGRLKAEAKELTGVDREWHTVTFDEPFPTEPVVFCNIVTNLNQFPLTVGIRNVTTSGFELCLKTEEAIEAYLIAEKINFLAIEPGQGVINGKRFTSGRSSEGNGLTSIPLEIEINPSYTAPIFFGGLLTAADNFASTLRYFSSGENKIKILKQRELSGEISGMKEDQVGWMIMDIAPDQDFSSIKDFNNDPISFYPNPVRDLIYLNFDRSTQIEIYDISGHKVLEAKVLDYINVNVLLAGIYVIKTEGRPPARFIKK